MSISSWTARLRSPSPVFIPWIANGSPMIEPTVLRGFSDEYGSWKIICISRRSSISCLALDVGDLLALELDRAAGRVEQPQQQAAGGRLAAAGLADEAERLAALDVERDAVDGVHGADLLAEDHPGGEREVLLEIADLVQRLAAAARAAHVTRRSPPRRSADRSCRALSGHHVGARLLGPLALAQVVPDPPAHAGVEQAGDAVAGVAVRPARASARPACAPRARTGSAGGTSSRSAG